MRVRFVGVPRPLTPLRLRPKTWLKRLTSPTSRQLPQPTTAGPDIRQWREEWQKLTGPKDSGGQPTGPVIKIIQDGARVGDPPTVLKPDEHWQITEVVANLGDQAAQALAEIKPPNMSCGTGAIGDFGMIPGGYASPPAVFEGTGLGQLVTQPEHVSNGAIAGCQEAKATPLTLQEATRPRLWNAWFTSTMQPRVQWLRDGERLDIVLRGQWGEAYTVEFTVKELGTGQDEIGVNLGKVDEADIGQPDWNFGRLSPQAESPAKSFTRAIDQLPDFLLAPTRFFNGTPISEVWYTEVVHLGNDLRQKPVIWNAWITSRLHPSRLQIYRNGRELPLQYYALPDESFTVEFTLKNLGTQGRCVCDLTLDGGSPSPTPRFDAGTLNSGQESSVLVYTATQPTSDRLTNWLWPAGGTPGSVQYDGRLKHRVVTQHGYAPPQGTDPGAGTQTSTTGGVVRVWNAWLTHDNNVYQWMRDGQPVAATTPADREIPPGSLYVVNYTIRNTGTQPVTGVSAITKEGESPYGGDGRTPLEGWDLQPGGESRKYERNFINLPDTITIISGRSTNPPATNKDNVVIDDTRQVQVYKVGEAPAPVPSQSTPDETPPPAAAGPEPQQPSTTAHARITASEGWTPFQCPETSLHQKTLTIPNGETAKAKFTLLNDGPIDGTLGLLMKASAPETPANVQGSPDSTEGVRAGQSVTISLTIPANDVPQYSFYAGAQQPDGSWKYSEVVACVIRRVDPASVKLWHYTLESRTTGPLSLVTQGALANSRIRYPRGEGLNRVVAIRQGLPLPPKTAGLAQFVGARKPTDWAVDNPNPNSVVQLPDPTDYSLNPRDAYGVDSWGESWVAGWRGCDGPTRTGPPTDFQIDATNPAQCQLWTLTLQPDTIIPTKTPTPIHLIKDGKKLGNQVELLPRQGFTLILQTKNTGDWHGHCATTIATPGNDADPTGDQFLQPGTISEEFNLHYQGPTLIEQTGGGPINLEITPVTAYSKPDGTPWVGFQRSGKPVKISVVAKIAPRPVPLRTGPLRLFALPSLRGLFGR